MATKKKATTKSEPKRSGCETCSGVASVDVQAAIAAAVPISSDVILNITPGCEMQYITYAQLQLAVQAMEAQFESQIAPLRTQLELARAAYLACAMTV